MNLLKASLLVLVVCCMGCSKKTSHDNNPQPATIPNIVILGSSTAAGEGANPIDSAWAFRLQLTVNANGTKANFTNLASPGYVTYQAMPNGYIVANRPVPDTARNITKALSLKPTLVMICFPTNDIADTYTDAEIMNNFAVMTHMLDSAKVQYIIFGTQPRNFTDVSERMRLKTLDDTIKTVYTYHVNDMLAQLSTSTYEINPLYSAGDGIHLNNAGHYIIFQATLNHPIFDQVVGLPVPK
jgi:acyl-CoA thioesterase-1